MSNEFIEKQYKLAIDARDKLNDNYYKWMSYYYLANAGVVVAVTTLFTKFPSSLGVLALSLIGVFVCILWHLSCKGYYYWSKSWIYIIIRLEKKLLTNETDLGVYSIFSEEVAKKEDHFLKPNMPANISTPKLTLLFSFCCILFWYGYSTYVFVEFIKWDCLQTIVTIIVFTLLLLFVYIKLLPKWIKSRDEKTHKLVKYIEDKSS